MSAADATPRMCDASGILSGDPGMSADAVPPVCDASLHDSATMPYAGLSAVSVGSVSHTVTRMSYRTDGMLSAVSVGSVSHTITRMSDASGTLSGDAAVSANATVSHSIARMSDASGVLSGNTGMSVCTGCVPDEALSDVGRLSYVIAAALSGSDSSRPLWWRAR